MARGIPKVRPVSGNYEYEQNKEIYEENTAGADLAQPTSSGSEANVHHQSEADDIHE